MLETVGQVANLPALHADTRQVGNLPHRPFLLSWRVIEKKK
jgi:hypothetical protein